MRIEFLKKIKNRRQRIKLFKTASPSEINSISEICFNCLKGRFNPPVKKLKIYKTPIRKLANRRLSLKKKRKYLVLQSGKGFWIPLLTWAIPTILSLLKK